VRYDRNGYEVQRYEETQILCQSIDPCRRLESDGSIWICDATRKPLVFRVRRACQMGPCSQPVAWRLALLRLTLRNSGEVSGPFHDCGLWQLCGFNFSQT